MRYPEGILSFMTDITQMLYKMQQGDTAAAEQLMPLVYDALRKLAARIARRGAFCGRKGTHDFARPF